MNKLMLGDCLALMSELPDRSVDMILCDLPYGTTRNKWDAVIPLAPLWAQYNRVIKDNGAIVLFAQTPFDKVLGSSNLQNLRYEWIWEKNRGTGHLNAKKAPMKNHENILVFYKKPPTYNPQMRGGDPYIRDQGGTFSTNYGQQVNSPTVNAGGRYPLTVINFKIVERTIHPTQKPVPLLEYLIKTYTQPGETVLDNAMGSGSTVIACINTGRSYIGMERDKQIFDTAVRRIAERSYDL